MSLKKLVEETNDLQDNRFNHDGNIYHDVSQKKGMNHEDPVTGAMHDFVKLRHYLIIATDKYIKALQKEDPVDNQDSIKELQRYFDILENGLPKGESF